MNAAPITSSGLAASAGTAPGDGRLGWALLVLAGLAAVAAAGWYGYTLQQASATEPARRPEVAVATPSPASAAMPSVRASAPGAAARPPVVRATAPRAEPGGTRAGKPVPPAAAASQPVLTWPMWEFQLRQPIPPRDPPLTPPSWRLIGATQSKDGWKVVVLRQGTTVPEYVGIGASLPGGYKIRAITEEDVTFDINKREVILSYTGSR